MEKYIVGNQDSGKRLDTYLSEMNKDLSRTMIKKIIDNNGVTVNEKQQKVSYKVQTNDEIVLIIPEAKKRSLNQKILILILYMKIKILLL